MCYKYSKYDRNDYMKAYHILRYLFVCLCDICFQNIKKYVILFLFCNIYAYFCNDKQTRADMF